MPSKSEYSAGLRFGLITGLIYAILLFLRFNLFGSNPVGYFIFSVVSYLVILTFFCLAGLARKRQQQGYASFREIFQTIFITILISEIVFILFNFIYLKFVDPSFFDSFKVATRNLYEKAKMTEEQIDKQMEKFKDVENQLTPLNLLKGLCIWIVVDSVFGMIIAAILKKKKEIFDETPPSA
jgi:hypothetical protein